jgi:chromosomal replication initiation ATPase DnaA
MQRVIEDNARLAREQERLRTAVEKLKQEREHWRLELIRQARELTGVGTIGIIQRIVCKEFDLSLGDLISQQRHQAVVRPRQIAQWLSHQCTGRSLPQIGRMFGGRDHTTILYAVRKIDNLRSEDGKFAALLMRLKGEVMAERTRIAATYNIQPNGDAPCHQQCAGVKKESHG